MMYYCSRSGGSKSPLDMANVGPGLHRCKGPFCTWQSAKNLDTRWNLAPRWIVGLQIPKKHQKVTRCQTWSGVGPKTGRKLTQISQKLSKSPKVNMLKFGDVSFDLGFERGRMSATGYVAKISMLRLNIGSGKLSSCMLSIGRGPKSSIAEMADLGPTSWEAFISPMEPPNEN